MRGKRPTLTHSQGRPAPLQTEFFRPKQLVNVWRTGWYVDDISIQTANFREIGTTSSTSFTVTGRLAGTYLYRVQALLSNGARSARSNPEQVRVTVGRNG